MNVSAIFLLSLFFAISFNGNAQDPGNFNFLRVGDQAPDFRSNGFEGEKLDSQKLLKKGKIVLMFYRGAWCPHCNKHMSHVQDSLELILNKGAIVIAVTTEIPEYIEKTIKKTGASFSIIHDTDHAIMNAYGTAFKVDDGLVKRYKLIGINLEKANGNDDQILAVPATFIINQNGVIEAIHFDENYRNRMSVAEILEHL